MAQKTFLFLAIFASAVSMILSVPQYIVPVPQGESQSQPDVPPPNNILVADNLPQLQRSFGSLLNLSAYLANAPNDSAALNFIPLITILSAAG